MSAFAIIVVCVTMAYIIWYGAMISKDVVTMSKEDTPEVETFEVDGVANAEQPVTVEETENGFVLHRGASAEETHADEPTVPTSNPMGADQQMVIYENMPQEGTPDDSIKEVTSQMEEAPTCIPSNEFLAEEFGDVLEGTVSNAPQIKREVVADASEIHKNDPEDAVEIRI